MKRLFLRAGVLGCGFLFLFVGTPTASGKGPGGGGAVITVTVHNQTTGYTFGLVSNQTTGMGHYVYLQPEGTASTSLAHKSAKSADAIALRFWPSDANWQALAPPVIYLVTVPAGKTAVTATIVQGSSGPIAFGAVTVQ